MHGGGEIKEEAVGLASGGAESLGVGSEADLVALELADAEGSG